MVKASEFCNAQNECFILLDSLETTTDYADKLLKFVGFADVDNDDNILKMTPLAEEHFNNLVKVAKQLSSYADRFNNKLPQLKKILNRFSSADYKDARKAFYTTLTKLLCDAGKPIVNSNGSVSPNKLISIRIDDAYERTGTDIVEIHVSSFKNTDPQLFIIMPFDSNLRMKVVYNDDIIYQTDIGDGNVAAESVAGCILSRM